jgi:hypothetical protein
MTSSRTGVRRWRWRRPPRIAYPSIAELSQGGSATVAHDIPAATTATGRRRASRARPPPGRRSPRRSAPRLLDGQEPVVAHATGAPMPPSARRRPRRRGGRAPAVGDERDDDRDHDRDGPEPRWPSPARRRTGRAGRAFPCSGRSRTTHPGTGAGGTPRTSVSKATNAMARR